MISFTRKQNIIYTLAILGITVLIFAASLLYTRVNSGREKHKFSKSEMTPKEADDFIKLNKESGLVTILDVRTPGEYNEGHIPGAVFIDYYADSFKQRLSTLDRNKTYILCCKAGRSCKHIIKKMMKEGFAEAHKITGGYAEWKSQNLPVDFSKVY